MGNTMTCVNDRSHHHHLSSSKCVHWNEYINKPVPSGETLLTIAAGEGNAELTQRLIGQGAHVNQTNVSGSSPLHVAVRGRHEDVVDVLLASCVDINARDRSGLTALHLACVTCSESIVCKLLESGSDPEGVMDGKFYVSTPLMAAAEINNQALAVILLGHHADVNKQDWWQNTALLKAVQVGSVPLVELLLRHGADPNVENRFGGSALHYSTIADHCLVTRMLVNGGCRVNVGLHGHHWSRSESGTGSRSSSGSNGSHGTKETIVKHSPLAASIHRDCYECFTFFLDRGADVNGEDTRRKTPLIYAVTNRAWDCNGRHSRPVPQCFHSDNPTSIDSTRMRFAVELIDRGARLRPVWEYVVWQMRALYVNAPDRDAICLCVRAMGFVHREDFKVETFYRTLALSAQWEALWTLYLAGFNITDECRTVALNKVRAVAESAGPITISGRNFSPDMWMLAVSQRPRSLKNLCVIKIRERLPDNVVHSARKLNIPKLLYRMICLEDAPIVC